MGIVTTAFINGLSHADGTTARVRTLARVQNLPGGGFVMRETPTSEPNQLLAVQVTYKSYETRGKNNNPVRHISCELVMPYLDPLDNTKIGGVMRLDRQGYHIPANAPINARKDFHAEIDFVTTDGGGNGTSFGKQCFVDPILAGAIAL